MSLQKVVIIGSFRKDFDAIVKVAGDLQRYGYKITSPILSGIVDRTVEFIRLESDWGSSIQEIQDNVLRKIYECDFVALVNPNEYVGASATLEIGYAWAIGKPVYALKTPSDMTLKFYVRPWKDLKLPKTSQPINTTLEINHLFFDADDTLWDDQGVLQTTERAIEQALDDYHGEPSAFCERFIQTEEKNIPTIGFGFHSYLFSLSETFFREARHHAVKEQFLAQVRDLTKAYLHEEPKVFSGVKETLEELVRRGFALHVLSRGIPLEQTTKLRRASLIDLFTSIHIVSDKNSAVFKNIVSELGLLPSQCCMIGNSLKSDIFPALEAGLRAVHIPTANQWTLDTSKEDASHHTFERIQEFCDLLKLFTS